jgi:predicted nucleic acid-binding protein
VSDPVVLDSGPVGVLTNPNPNPAPVAIRQWLADLQARGRRVILPEIADYEIRREFLLGNMAQSLTLLDALGVRVEYLPLVTATMRRAAELWARARRTGRPTAPDPALDGDVILAAQAESLGVQVIVATGNPAHLGRFVPADLWQNIVP